MSLEPLDAREETTSVTLYKVVCAIVLITVTAIYKERTALRTDIIFRKASGPMYVLAMKMFPRMADYRYIVAPTSWL